MQAQRQMTAGMTAALLTLGALVISSSVAGAQGAPPAGWQVMQPHAGDCSVTVQLPAGAAAADVSVSINTREVVVNAVQQEPYVGLLADPLAVNSNVTVTVKGQPMTMRVMGPAVGGI